MNVKIPAEVNQKIQRVAEALKASKTEVVIALLNEGLDVSESLVKLSRRVKADKPAARATKGAACGNAGCTRPAVARGLCAKHYQAERRKRMGKKK
jgi:hypothetical protein